MTQKGRGLGDLQPHGLLVGLAGLPKPEYASFEPDRRPVAGALLGQAGLLIETIDKREASGWGTFGPGWPVD